MIDVFVVGALHLDVVVDAPRLPLLDETLMGDGVAYRFGGKGGNQALAAARMGARVAMAGRVGDDRFAAMVLETLAASGVEHAQVRQTPGATGMSVAIVEQGGEYGAVVVSGVNQTINPDEIDVEDARVILLQNEIPEAVNHAVTGRLPQGAKVVLNAAPARATSGALLEHIDLLVANRLEAAEMTDCGDADLDEMAKRLVALGPRAAIVTGGKDGACVFDGDQAIRIAPPLVAQGSAHGAGDAFVGALAAEIAKGAGLQHAARFAAAAAAHFVQTQPGARAAISRADVVGWRARISPAPSR